MNVRVYDQLLKLSKSWPAMLGFVGPIVAFGADSLYRLVSTKEGAKLLDAAGQCRTSEWDDFYRSSKAWLNRVPEQAIPAWLPFSLNELADLKATLPGDPAIIADLLNDLQNQSKVENAR